MLAARKPSSLAMDVEIASLNRLRCWKNHPIYRGTHLTTGVWSEGHFPSLPVYAATFPWSGRKGECHRLRVRDGGPPALLHLPSLHLRHLYICLRQTNHPFSLPSASKYTTDSVFKNRGRKAYWYKGCSHFFSPVWQRDFSNTPKGSVARWLVGNSPFSSKKRKVEGKQELLRSQT